MGGPDHSRSIKPARLHLRESLNSMLGSSLQHTEFDRQTGTQQEIVLFESRKGI